MAKMNAADIAKQATRKGRKATASNNRTRISYTLGGKKYSTVGVTNTQLGGDKASLANRAQALLSQVASAMRWTGVTETLVLVDAEDVTSR